jgi:hypothetical protein
MAVGFGGGLTMGYGGSGYGGDLAVGLGLLFLAVGFGCGRLP